VISPLIGEISPLIGEISPLIVEISELTLQKRDLFASHGIEHVNNYNNGGITITQGKGLNLQIACITLLN
jgi:hypothetical protein